MAKATGCDRNGRGRAALGLLAPFFRRHALRLAVGFVALLGVDGFQLLIPRFIKSAVDGLARGTADSGFLAGQAGWILALAVAIAGCRFLWRYLILGFSRLVERDLRQRLVAHLFNLDRVFFQNHPPGTAMALATNDLTAVQLACGMGLVAAVDAAVMTSAALGFMAYIHPGLTLIAVLPMPLLALLTRLLTARLHQRFSKVQEQFARLTEFARSSLHFIRLYQAFVQERAQTARFDRLGREYVRDNLRLATIHGTLFPVSGLVANLSLLLVVVFGGRLVIREVISAGDFVAFISYLFMLTWPMMALGWVMNLFQRGFTSLERLCQVFAARPALPEPSSPAPLSRLRGTITVRHLEFSYPGRDQPALTGINLELGPGITGVTGRTGAGKSTLCQLLARLYPVPDQTLFYDGIDANRLPVELVRQSLSYVPQETILFSDTIAANIALGDPEAGQERIEAAARTAAIHEEILAMPAGYQTRIGEKGVRLSGGQKQRLALARALLVDRPIMIIDDGLSAVDVDTEQRIIQALGPVLAGRTCLVVSHRIAALRGAGVIVVMEQGRIVARGSHEQLLAASGFYAAIHEQQVTGDS